MKSFFNRKPLLLSIIIFGCIQCFSQDHLSLFMSDINGAPIPIRTEMNINGSPFFPSDYVMATLYLPGGKKIENVKTKIFLPEHSIYYQLNDKSEMVAITAIERIEFFSSMNIKPVEFRSYPLVAEGGNKFYEVLADGKVQLLKLYTSDFTDRKEFGSATITRTYDNLIRLYVYTANKKILKINNSEDFFADLFKDRQKQFSIFVQKEKISFRREADLIKLFDYYNTLN